MKKGLLCLILSLMLLFQIGMSAAEASMQNNNEGMQKIQEDLSQGLPMSGLTYGESIPGSGKVMVAIFLDPSRYTDDRMISYLIHARAVLGPYIDQRKVTEYLLTMHDEWGVLVLEYSSKGTAYGTLIDRRSGKQIKTKFSSSLDLLAYFSDSLPDETGRISKKKLALLNEAVQYFAANPKDSGKKAAKALAKKHNTTEKRLLADINSAYDKLYGLEDWMPMTSGGGLAMLKNLVSAQPVPGLEYRVYASADGMVYGVAMMSDSFVDTGVKAHQGDKKAKKQWEKVKKSVQDTYAALRDALDAAGYDDFALFVSLDIIRDNGNPDSYYAYGPNDDDKVVEIVNVVD